MNLKKVKILSVVNDALKLKIANLSSQDGILENQEVKEDLIKVLDGFYDKGHLVDFRVSVFNMMFDCKQIPNKISIDVWTKHDDPSRERPTTFNYELEYEI